MNIYDDAHRLARSIKESSEFKEYKEKKEIAFADPKNKEMIEDFQKKAIEVQMAQMSDEKPDKEKIEQVQKLENILMLNPVIKDYLMAEASFSQIISDVYKILEDAMKVEKGE
jgi:cell fate (sporulation/competence/biofilm development) regulator YlbF (YheA/YmcA/DUF963 family)